MSWVKLPIISLLGVVIMVFVSANTIQVSAAENIEGNLCKGANLSLSGSAADCKAECKDSKGKTVSCEEKANTLIETIINVFSVVVGIVAVIMIVYGGFRYITSGGDSNNITTAKNVIIYALIGLVIVALAQSIVKFILSKITT